MKSTSKQRTEARRIECIESGVVVYGEIAPHIAVGTRVVAGTLIGVAIPVLKHDKGRPMCMLHLELHTSGSRSAPEWLTEEKPEVLIDPTSFLLNAQCLTKTMGKTVFPTGQHISIHRNTSTSLPIQH